MKSFSVFVAMAALVIGIATIAQHRTSSKVAATPDLPDQDWAKAVWFSQPFGEGESDEAAAAFKRALAKATHQAPIYVAMGDADSGPQSIGEMTNQFAHDYEQGRVQGRSKIQTGVDAIVERMKHGTESTQACYAAAITADPTYKPAWFRLAKYGDKETAQVAINELRRLDPDNGLLDYLQAAKDVKVANIPEALSHIRLGNSKPACRLYPNRMPTQFDLRYSNDESFRKAGVAGKRIPASAFAYLITKAEEAWSFSDPLPGELRQVVRELIEAAERMTQAGEFVDAESHLLAIQGMGRQLIAEETGNTGLTLTGLFFIRTLEDPLTALYLAANQTDKLSEHQRLIASCLKVYDQLDQTFDQIKPSDKDMQQILLGEKDALVEEKEAMRATLRLLVSPQ